LSSLQVLAVLVDSFGDVFVWRLSAADVHEVTDLACLAYRPAIFHVRLVDNRFVVVSVLYAAAGICAVIAGAAILPVRRVR